MRSPSPARGCKNPTCPQPASTGLLVMFDFWSTTVRISWPNAHGSSTGCAGISCELDPTWDPPARSFDPNKTVAQITANLAGQQGTVAGLARRLLQRCVCLTEEIQALEVEIGEQVEKIAVALLEVCGCGPLSAAKIIGETADVRRFRSKDAFARYNGTALLPVWSSNHPRHRLTPSRQPSTRLRDPSNRAHASPLASQHPRLSAASQGRRGHL
jgi:hypothetical protein